MKKKLIFLVFILITSVWFGEGCGGDAAVSIPDIPQGVDATASGDTVAVTWDEVDGATSYNIYWSTTAGVTKDNGTKIEEVTSPYEHEGLTYGEAYYYVVTAVNDAGESDVSEEVSVTIAYPVPAAPSDVAAESDGSTVTVTWDAANYATSYNIYWRTSTGVTKANGTKISGVTSPY